MDTAPRLRLAELGLELPAASPPKGSYVPAVRSGALVHISGQIPMAEGRLLAHGRVGAEVSAAQAHDLAGQCALAALAAVDAVAGLEAIVRVVKITGYVAVAPGFTGLPRVLDGASELFAAVLGPAAGRCARSVAGVARLPLDVPLELEVLTEVGSR